MTMGLRLSRASLSAVSMARRSYSSAPPPAQAAPSPILKSSPSTASTAGPCPPHQCSTVESCQISVTPMVALSPPQQKHLMQLRAILDRAAALCAHVPPQRPSASQRPGTLVACRIDCRFDKDPALPAHFTGVNHALHARVNGGGGGVLKGILKGCAEQNALGALAACGAPYTSVSQVFLASIAAEPGSPPNHSCASCASCGAVKSLGIFFPCPECWCHLTRVANIRAADGLPALKLLVWAGTVDDAVAAMSVAATRMERHNAQLEVTFVTEH